MNKHLLNTLIVFTVLFGACNKSYAQIKDGHFAPDTELTDLEGNTYNLYAILDEGKSVVLDFSATWCEPCWDFHNSGVLKQLHQEYGEEISIFTIEADPLTAMECLMNDPDCDEERTGNVTLGNWVDGVPYPIVNDDEAGALFQIAFFPTIYAICPDRTVTLLNPEGNPNFQEVVDVITTCSNTEGGENNLKAHVYTGETDYLCSTVQPSFFIQNYGDNAITKATFALTINGDTVEIFNWEGSLVNQYDFEEIEFTEHEITDFNSVEFIIIDVNGEEDSDLSNNTYIQQINKAIATLDNEIEITIKTDNYGNETYWAILDEAGEILIEGGNETVGLYYYGLGYPYEHESAYANNTSYTENFELPEDGCYRAIVTDAYGDGFCCSAGSGSFEIKNSKGEILLNVSNELQGIFEAGLRFEQEAPRANFFIEQDANLITVTDASALAEQWFWVFEEGTDTIRGKTPRAYIYDLNGIYEICLKVENEFGEDTICQQVEITDAPVGVNELDVSQLIEIAPNPAKNWITIDMVQLHKTVQQIEVFNVEGKLMKSEKLNTMSSSFIFDLSDLGNGIYLLSFKFEGSRLTKRLILH